MPQRIFVPWHRKHLRNIGLGFYTEILPGQRMLICRGHLRPSHAPALQKMRRGSPADWGALGAPREMQFFVPQHAALGFPLKREKASIIERFLKSFNL